MKNNLPPDIEFDSVIRQFNNISTKIYVKPKTTNKSFDIKNLRFTHIHDKGYNFLIKEGEYLSDQWFDYAKKFRNGFALVYIKEQGYNFIDINGKYLSDIWFHYAKNFRNGFAMINLNDKFNFIKPDGTYLLETWCNFTSDFRNGVTTIFLDDKTHVINTNGEIVK